MNAEYFEEHIYEELNGACDYIKKAIELKAMDPAMSKTLADMSAAELSHATQLHKMFGEYYAKVSGPYKETPAYLVKIKDEIEEVFPEKSAKILLMHEMYKK